MRQSRQAIALGLISSTLLMAACATRPAPLAPVAPTPTPTPREVPPPPPPPAAQPPRPTPPPPITVTPTPAPVGVLPGSSQDFVVSVGDRVYFDLDSSSIRADAQPVLAAQAAWLARYPTVNIRIEGNADERGTREYNLALGDHRANAIKDFLVGKGVNASRITTLSYGKERPLDSGTGEAAWAKNRNGQTVITSGAR
ncbi:MAG: pal [Caulobacteraceae bacterium]|nr:pal [Caulobacteraceae bacterium]